MIESYQRLTEFFQEIQARKMKLNDQKRALILRREQLSKDWGNEVFAGRDGEAAKAAIFENEKGIAEFSDHIRILEDGVKTSSKVAELSQAVHAEAEAALSGMRKNYLSQAQKVEKIRKNYLRELATLGAINNIATKYSFYASEANQYLPVRVHVGLNADKFRDVMITEKMINENYKKGVL